MRNTPEIVKELREAEKLSLIQNKVQNIYDAQETINESNDDIIDNSINFNEDDEIKNHISEEGKIEKEIDILRNKEEFYEAIFDNSSIAITFADENEKIISWNKFSENLLGLKDLYMKPIESIYPSDEWKKIRSENIRKKGMKHHFETKIIGKDNKLIDVDISLSVIKNKKGKVTGSIGVIKDISDRKKAEEMASESENRYRDLFENANDLIQSISSDGTFLYVNRSWRETLGYTDDEIKNISVFDIIHPDQRDHCMKVFKDIMSGESIDTVETSFVTKDGQEVIVEGNVSCRFKDGKPFSTRGIFRNVTERKKSEEKMVHAVKEWEITFDSISDLVSIMDENYVILNANKAFIDTFNMRREDVIGKHCHEIVHSSGKPFPSCPHLQTLKTKKPVTVEFFAPNLGVYLEVSTSPIFDEKGSVIGTTHIAKNITDRKNMEEKLRGSKEKTEDILNGAADGIRIIGKDFKVQVMNQTMAELTGISAEKGVGMKCRDMFKSENCGTKECPMVKILKTGKSYSYEDLRKRADGKDVPVLTLVSPYKDKKGNIVGIIEDFRDIAEIKKVEKSLEDKIDELERYKKFTVNRELKMAELKKRIAELEGKSG